MKTIDYVSCIVKIAKKMCVCDGCPIVSYTLTLFNKWSVSYRKKKDFKFSIPVEIANDIGNTDLMYPDAYRAKLIAENNELERKFRVKEFELNQEIIEKKFELEKLNKQLKKQNK